MSARCAAVADAVVALLNTQFADDFVAVRRWVPAVQLEDIKSAEQPLVVVVPVTETPYRTVRGAKEDDIVISVGLIRKLSADSDGDTDDGCELAEQVYDYLWNLDLTTLKAKFVDMAMDTMADPASLESHRVHVAVVNVTYRV